VNSVLSGAPLLAVLAGALAGAGLLLLVTAVRGLPPRPPGRRASAAGRQIRGIAGTRGALALLAAWLLRDCCLERVELLTEPDNEPMLAAARAAGFVYEGVLRAYLLEHGQRIDVAILSLLPGDLEV